MLLAREPRAFALAITIIRYFPDCYIIEWAAPCYIYSTINNIRVGHPDPVARAACFVARVLFPETTTAIEI